MADIINLKTGEVKPTEIKPGTIVLNKDIADDEVRFNESRALPFDLFSFFLFQPWALHLGLFYRVRLKQCRTVISKAARRHHVIEHCFGYFFIWHHNVSL